MKGNYDINQNNIKKLTTRTVDYVWDNFNKYIFSDKEFLSFYKEVEEIIKSDKKFKKIFGNNIYGFWKIFREFRVQKADIMEDELNEYIEYHRKLLWG